jgi:hypothetical protein
MLWAGSLANDDAMSDHRSDEIVSLWHIHRDAPWPGSSGTNEGPLMTLDTVITGCVTYYLDSGEGLDEQRIEILATCLQDLEGLLQELPDEAREYFNRLLELGSLLLGTQR